MTITIRRYDELPVDLVDPVYCMYAEVFAEVNALAAQRHVVNAHEFVGIAADARVTKYLAYDRDELVGIATLTNDLHAWPLASPSYYSKHFPDHSARSAVWYIGFLGAKPGHLHVFSALVGEMYPRVIDSDGVAAMDFCTFNVDRRLPEATYLMLLRMNPATQVSRLDEQVTYVYRFDGKGEPVSAVVS